MKKQMGWPSMQKNSQKDTFPNSLLYSFRCFESNFSKAMAGACIIMARKAQQLTTPRGTQTTYSWATADSTKTRKFAPNLDHPFLRRGVQQCLMKKKCTGRFHVFQYSSRFLQFHQSMQKLRSPNWMISDMMLRSRWKKEQKPMIHPMVLGIERRMRRQTISIQSPFPQLLIENQAYSYGYMYCTHTTSSRAKMTTNSTILFSSQGTLMGGDLGYSSWQHRVGAIKKQASLLRVISNCQSRLFFTIISRFSALISWLAKTNSLNQERASAADRSRMERISVLTCMQLTSFRNSTSPKAVKSSPETGLFFRKLAQQSAIQTSRVT